MNPFLLSPKERLEDWKLTRRSLSALSEDDQVAAVARYFSQAPIRNIAYDIDDPKTWPSIWQMVDAGNWCRNSLAIGMVETLRLGGWNSSRLNLQYVINYQDSIAALVVLIDRERLLNYQWASVTKRPPELRTVKRYYWDGHNYGVKTTTS